MKLSFAMPNMVRLKAMAQPWEREVTGADRQLAAPSSISHRPSHGSCMDEF